MAGTGGFRRPHRGTSANPLREMPALYDAALDEFSRKSFDEASLNDIIKAVGLNKGSFYYRFSDKTDLYLCMIDLILRRKLEYFARTSAQTGFPTDFFDQIRALAAAGLQYARHEPRFYAFWRRFLAESGAVRLAVKEAFPGVGHETMQPLVDAAQARGQFRAGFPDGFIAKIVELVFNNIDSLITAESSDGQIATLLDHLVEMLRSGLAAQETPRR